MFWSHSPLPQLFRGILICVSLVATFCFLSARIWNRFSDFFLSLHSLSILVEVCLVSVLSQSSFFFPTLGRHEDTSGIFSKGSSKESEFSDEMVGT